MSTETKTRYNYNQFFNGFNPSRHQQQLLWDSGIEDFGYKIYSSIRSSIDYVYHAEYYLRDPNDPNLPLRLEPWQKEELRYCQFGEAYWQMKYEGLSKDQALDKFATKSGSAYRKPIAINSPRGFGKSIFSTVVAIEFALHFPQHQIALFSTSQEQSSDLMHKVRYFVKNSIFAYMIDKSNETEFTLSNGSRIKAFPQSEVTIRGFHPHLKIIDEKARIKQEILESAIRPMGRNKNVLEIGISTPFGMNNNHYRDCMDPEHFHVHILKPTEVSWVDEEKLAREMALTSDLYGRQELYAEFIADASSVYNPTLIARMFNPKLKIKEQGEGTYKYIIGTDFGKHRDYSSIVISHMDSRGRIIVDRIEAYKHVDYDVIIDRIIHLCTLFDVQLIVPDGTGVGVAIMEMLRKALGESGLNVMIYKSLIKRSKKEAKLTDKDNKKDNIRFGFLFTNNSKINIVDELLKTMMNNRIWCIDHGNTNDKNSERYVYKLLEEDLSNFSYSHTPAGNITFEHSTAETHGDILIGLMLNVWGYKFLRKLKLRKQQKEDNNGDLGRGGRIPVRTYGIPVRGRQVA